jgi:VIT1/CCC1 family predicted Fe2+/Mn2+ transporter
MADTPQIRTYRANWQSEYDAVYLYNRLAASEPSPELASIYRRLAETEKKHLKIWEDKLGTVSGRLPHSRPSMRVRLLGGLAGWFGVSFVLPTLAGLEKAASSDYDNQPEALAHHMPQDERSHARIFNFLSRSSAGLEGKSVARLEGRHRSGGNALRAGVLGANDGLVSNFSLVMGVAGAQVHTGTLLVTGLAGLLAGAISMALGEWLSVQSSRELYENQIQIEKQELESAPEEEKEELTLIYQAKGLPAEEAARLAERLLQEPASALDTLSREELGIDPQELGGSAWEAAAMSFLLFALGAILPVLPFFFFKGATAVLSSAGLSGLGLFVIGSSITLVTGKHWLGAGLRQVLFGLAAAAITFGIGRLIGVNLGG